MSQLLDDLRAAQKGGYLNKLTPAERAKLWMQVQPELDAERKTALEPPKPVETEAPKSGFLQDVAAPVMSLGKNPVSSVVSMARGVEKSYNLGQAVGIDLEELEGAFSFPIIRGAELAARLFVPADQRPDLKTYNDVVNDQRSMDEELRKVAPGWQEGSELGSVAAGTVQLANTGLKIATGLARKAPQAARAAYQWLQKTRATQTQKQTTTLAKKLLRIGDGPFLDAIVQRPEKVAQLVNETDGLTANDLAVNLKNELETIGMELGSRVGKFRDAAFADTTTRIRVPEDIAQNLAAIRQRTTFANPTRVTGKATSIEGRLSQASEGAQSILPGDIQKRLAMTERAAALGVTNPNQAMVWVDMLDDIIDYANSGKPGSTAIKSSNAMLMQVRGSIKNALRGSSKWADSWASADDAFSGFVDRSGRAIQRLNSESSESLVANLFSKNRTPMRNDIEAALNYAEMIDPTAKGAGNAFFSRLADIRASEIVKGVRNQITDPIQDNVNRIVLTWTKRGEKVGAAVATAAGGLPGLIGGSNLGVGYGGGVGFLAGRAVGAMAGEAIGKRMADPTRILDSAIKAKELSKDAKALASDLRYMVEAMGPESTIAFFDVVGPIPAVKELIKFSNQREKEK